MLERTIRIKTVEDILTPEQIRDYHKTWNDFYSQNKDVPENHLNVVKDPEHVVIGKVWQYSPHPIYRAQVLPDRLGWITMDPPQSIWHEYHYWQVSEQLVQASRRKYFEQINKRHIGKGKTPVVLFDLKIPIPLENQKISAELISEIGIKNRSIDKGGPFTIESHSLTFYNGRNEILGRVFGKIFAELRDYEVLFEQLKQGKSEALPEFITRIKSMEGKLQRKGRIPQVSADCLIQELSKGNLSDDLYEKIEDFFSLWDLR